MSDISIFDTITGATTLRNYTDKEIADIEASKPTSNELLKQQVDILRATITNDIRDRAALGDTADLKAIYDQINALESQKT